MNRRSQTRWINVGRGRGGGRSAGTVLGESNRRREMPWKRSCSGKLQPSLCTFTTILPRRASSSSRRPLRLRRSPHLVALSGSQAIPGRCYLSSLSCDARFSGVLIPTIFCKPAIYRQHVLQRLPHFPPVSGRHVYSSPHKPEHQPLLRHRPLQHGGRTGCGG